MSNDTSHLENQHKSSIQKTIFFKHMIKVVIIELILLPLVALDIISAFYSALLKLIKIDIGNIWFDRQEQKKSKQIMQITHTVDNHSYCFKFYTPNWICRYRANTFSTKEPETLEWIDNNGDDGAFFDIGANVGLYSIYYGMTKKGNIYAFEPSVFNLALLTKNINENNLQNKINVITNPLTEINQFADFSFSTTVQGGALSAFGVDYGQDGKSLQKVFSYKTLGLTLDSLFISGILKEYPRMIKIDVDGIEHLILRGAINTLSNPVCKTVLVEVMNDFSAQADEVTRILTACGFSLENKPNSLMLDKSGFPNTPNQIWIKN